MRKPRRNPAREHRVDQEIVVDVCTSDKRAMGWYYHLADHSTSRVRGGMTKPLTLAAVKRLVATGESATLEFKRATAELSKATQALCGFLNQRGGAVVCGVAPDGRIVGQANDGTLRASAAPYTCGGRPFTRTVSTTRRMKREEYERRLLARLHARRRWETLQATGWSIADHFRLGLFAPSSDSAPA